MENIQYLIIHKDSPLSIQRQNGGAEMVSLYLGRYFAAAGDAVVVAARLTDPEEKIGSLEYRDLGSDYDVERILKQVSKRGPYHLIANSHSLPLVLSRRDPNCLSRVLLTEERHGAAGLQMEVISEITDAIACVSHAQRSLLIGEGADPEKTTVVYNGVDLNHYAAGDPAKRNWRNLIFAGALVQDKGIHFLIEAYAKLKQKYSDLTLDVYGSAALWHRDEFINPEEIQRALPGIVFHGSVPPVELVPAYQRAGICVVPSIWFEPFGMIASDALATGCPVVTFDVGGPAEIVQHGKNGLVLKDISPGGLAVGLDQLLGDPDQLKALARGALAERERFDWARMVKQFKEICQGAAAARPAPPEISRSVDRPVKTVPAAQLSESPLVSVVTVSFNQAEFIRDNIESVLAQNYSNFEHIIVDAGSTDGTLEILKEYPHLKWTSEPDRGQSHGLNKGFHRATGDIIVWLNSDDWLAPECFQRIIPALRDNNTVIASAARTDRAGEVQEIVPNVAREWADLLKFWVPYAWFAQTSIFFRREFLHSVRLPDGDFFDEDLFFTMDIDLWIRMAERESFSNRIDAVCSYFRIYEENKTGEDGPAAQRECSRLFRRHCHAGTSLERRFSVLLPVSSATDDILATLNSITAQELPDVEVLLIARGGGVNRKALRKIAGELDQNISAYCIRPVFSESDNLLEAFNCGMRSATGRYSILMQPGDQLQPNFLIQVEKVFVYDWIGLVLPLHGKSELLAALQGDEAAGAQPTMAGLLSAPLFSPALVARTTALRDLGGFKETASSAIGVRELALRALYKSWHVIADRPLAISENTDYSNEQELFTIFESYIVAKLISDLFAESQTDLFYLAKLEHGNAISFSSELIANARAALALAPSGWERFDYINDCVELERICTEHPNFSPAWYLLSKLLAEEGRQSESEQARSRYQQLSTVR